MNVSLSPRSSAFNRSNNDMSKCISSLKKVHFSLPCPPERVVFNMSNVSKNKHFEARVSPVTVSAFCESDSSRSFIDTILNTNVSKDSSLITTVTSCQRALRRTSLDFDQPSSHQPCRRVSLDSLVFHTAPTATSNSNDATAKYQMPVWTQGSNTNKAVFLRHLIRPATVLQSHARGMIQRAKYQKLRMERATLRIQSAVRGYNSRQFWKRTQAATTIQSMARHWFYRLNCQVIKMQSHLNIIESNRQDQLRQIEQQKQLELDRIYRELEAQANIELLQQGLVCKQQIGMAQHLRENSQRLAKQNKKLRKACLSMAKKNEECLKLVKQTQENTQELENIIPRLKSDRETAQAVLDMWSQRTEEFRLSLQACQENIAAEKAIGRIIERGIEKLVYKIDAECTGIDLMESIMDCASAGLEEAWNKVGV